MGNILVGPSIDWVVLIFKNCRWMFITKTCLIIIITNVNRYRNRFNIIILIIYYILINIIY